MPKRDDKLLLQDIIEAGNKIIKFTSGLNYDEFSNDVKTVDAVLRNFEIIGEAAGRFSEKLQIAHPEIEWRKLKAFRNLLIHEYFGVNLPIVWDLIQNYLPQTILSIQQIANESLKK